jgi:hypothetical protein
MFFIALVIYLSSLKAIVRAVYLVQLRDHFVQTFLTESSGKPSVN